MEYFIKNGTLTKDEDTQVISCHFKSKEAQLITISDAHLDNSKVNKNWLYHQLDKEFPNAYILFDGDSIDMMQAKSDPRSSKSDLGQDFKTDSYVNKTISLLRSICEKYKGRIIGFNRGNHDNEYWRRHDIDVLSAAVGDKVPIGNFRGFYKLTFNAYKSKYNCVIYYQHAPYSGGKRSKGMLSVDMLKAQYHNVDIFLTGHIHENFQTVQASWKFNVKTLKANKHKMLFLQQTTLKQEDESLNGFHAERVKTGAGIQGFYVIDFKVKKVQKINKLTYSARLVDI